MDARQTRHQLTRRRFGRQRLLLVALLGLLAFPSAAAARTRHYWVAAVPKTWNLVPNGRDAILDQPHAPAETVFGALTYQRYTKDWKRPLRGAIPGPHLRARVGDHVRVHFKNLDPARPHSMHFHGFTYKPSSDGAFLPGFSGRDGDVRPGRTWTYELFAGKRSRGVWPYHDHSPSMHDSIEGGMYGITSIYGRREKRPDREFVVAFAPLHEYQTINGRAFVGNPPVYRAKVGDRVRWSVMAMGSEHHTFHVHGHRWLGKDGRPEDTRTLGPADSFSVDYVEDAPGTWFYHCHVEDHMARGMIGVYQVKR
jgi:FtsP/CotA-like multicopper oxidase with cupredoxin domain